MRLAIISTPRSGNTWVRGMMARLLNAAELAVHDINSVDWRNISANIVVQVYAHRDPEVLERLASFDVKVITLARHPLDVLVSILQFAPHNPQTNLWLSGDGGSEMSIIAASPSSQAFRIYGTGPRARALLSVSAEWWESEGVARVRYEDLVASTDTTLHGLLAFLGAHPVTPVDQVAAAFRISVVANDANYGHYWLGRPGLWRQLVPNATAKAIGRAHSGVFERLGYPLPEGSTNMSRHDLDRAWISLRLAPRAVPLMHRRVE